MNAPPLHDHQSSRRAEQNEEEHNEQCRILGNVDQDERCAHRAVTEKTIKQGLACMEYIEYVEEQFAECK